MNHNCSKCFQIRPNKSPVVLNKNNYMQIYNYNNNMNNIGGIVPVPYPKPPTFAQKQAIKNKQAPAPFDMPDYFQDYQLYNKSSKNFNESLKNAYPLPNNKCIKEKYNKWSISEVKEVVREFNLKNFICREENFLSEKWRNKLSIRKLREILNYYNVFKYYYNRNHLKRIIQHYLCNY